MLGEINTCKQSSSVTYTENNIEGKIGQPLVPLPFSPSLLIIKLKVQSARRMCSVCVKKQNMNS